MLRSIDAVVKTIGRGRIERTNLSVGTHCRRKIP